MQYFYCQSVNGQEASLFEDESKHCVRVLRRDVGDQINVLDGRGNHYKGSIVEAGNIVQLTNLELVRSEENPTCQIHIAVAPTKSGDRIEWMLEKLVEVGVHKVTFIHTDNGERPRVNMKRMNKKALSAMKQSGNLWLPEITDTTKLTQLITQETAETRYIAHCYNEERAVFTSAVKTKSVVLLIGPEGDFSRQELSLAEEHGFTSFSLGKNRLRTETAAVAGCTLINHFCVTLAE